MKYKSTALSTTQDNSIAKFNKAIIELFNKGKIGSEKINTIEQILNLTELIFIGIDFSIKEMGVIANFIKDNNTFASISLDFTNIETNGLKPLTEALRDNGTLTSLSICCNEIENKMAESIAEILKIDCILSSLKLQCDEIEPEGIKLFAEALKYNNILTELILYNINVGVEGARSVAEALKYNNTLTSLSLDYCNIGVEGAKFLAEALEVNGTLTSLSLNYNKIGAEGAISLAEALKSNNTLTSLSLQNNIIGNDGGEALLKVQQQSKFLCIKGLSIKEINALNKVHEDAIKKYIEMIKLAIVKLAEKTTDQDIANDKQKAHTLKDALIMPTKTLHLLLEDEQAIKKLFTNKRYFIDKFRTELAENPEMSSTEEFYKQLNFHKNEYFFALRGICLNPTSTVDGLSVGLANLPKDCQRVIAGYLDLRDETIDEIKEINGQSFDLIGYVSEKVYSCLGWFSDLFCKQS